MKKIIKNLSLIALFLVSFLVNPVGSHAATEISIGAPSNGSVVTSSEFTVSGTATANRTVTVKVNGQIAGTTTSNGTGNWSLNISGQSAGAKTIEATASGQLLYTNILNVGDFSSSRMSRINTLTNTEESSFSIFGAGAFPINWKPNPSFTKAYGVAPYLNSGTVWVMDLVDGTVTTFTLPGAGQRGASIAYNTDGSKVYITDNANTDVIVYDTETNAQIGSAIGIGTAPHSNTHRPGTNEIWIDNSSDGTLSVIDTTSDTIIHTYNVGGSPNGMAISPDGSKVYVGQGSDIQIIDADTGTEIDTITGSASQEYLLLNSNATKLYSSHPGPTDDTIDVFNLNSNTLEDTITVGANGPWGLALNSDDSRLYVAIPNLQGGLSGSTIAVVDTSTNTLLETLTPGGGAPFFIFASPVESASSTINITISGANKLAGTGQNINPILIAGFILLLSSSTLFWYAHRHKTYKSSKN